MITRTTRRPRPLADLLGACLEPAMQAQGFAASDVILAWPEIVGERLARFTQPIRMEWRRRTATQLDRGARPEPATLVLRVESAFALEMQHLAPLIIERVNALYGWRCVGRLVLKQGPVGRAGPRREPRPALSAAQRERVEAAIEGFEDERLRGALNRLGTGVLGT